MVTKSGALILPAFIVIIAILSAGCLDGSQTTTAETTVPPTAVSPKFMAGDIIAKTATSTDIFLLVVKYDAATDRYERALVYKKPDGIWYRRDDMTEVTGRTVIEKIYLAKVAHVGALRDIPVVMQTTATTVPTVTVTTTTTSYPAPTVSSITPASGLAGTTVTITSLSGTNFRAGAGVRLTNATSSSIIYGTSVTARSASNITCRFSIPSNAIAGAWNVTVTNPDGQAATLGNAFRITNTTTTTTTTTTAPTSPTVSGITPSSASTGMQINITNLAGSNLLNVTSVKLTKSGQSDITATNVSIVSYSQVTGTINLAGAAPGQWNVLVSNSGGQSAIGTNIFTVNPLPPVAAFIATPLTGSSPLSVEFTDQSTGSPTTWSWIFGDQNTSTSSNPVHTYVFAGNFSVSLTVTNAGGSNSTIKSDYITVT